MRLKACLHSSQTSGTVHFPCSIFLRVTGKKPNDGRYKRGRRWLRWPYQISYSRKLLVGFDVEVESVFECYGEVSPAERVEVLMNSDHWQLVRLQ